MKLSETAVVEIVSVALVEAHSLRLRFSDGAVQVIRFAPFLNRSTNLHIRKYLDPDLFTRYTFADGDLYWDDYDLCFPLADLYRGCL